MALGPRVLIVDDDQAVRRALSRALRRDGYRVSTASEGHEALVSASRESFDLVCLDLELPDLHGFDVLAALRDGESAPVVVIVSGHTEPGMVVKALRLGAADFVPKDGDLGVITKRLGRALNTTALRTAIERRPHTELPHDARSRGMRVAYRMADRVARSPTTSVLILGETGVGKGVMARYIHNASQRRNQPFVSVNVAALPEGMVEAELFGTTAGAYTGSSRDRAGLFASADGGTVLLDEIFEFKLELQAKLLQVLEERRFFPLGSDEPRNVDLRVLAATNRDPERAVRQKNLREDLFYRLSTVVIHIPPLRERSDEILPLAQGFLTELVTELGVPRIELSDAACDILQSHHWPGNVRELRNAMERAVLMAPGDVIEADDFDFASTSLTRRLPSEPPRTRAQSRVQPISEQRHGPPSEPPPSLEEARQRAIADVERTHIERALARAGGRATEAAKLLGVSRSTLWEKLKRYDLRGK